MRKFLMLCLVTALANALSAQSPARPGAQPATTPKNTNTQPLKPRSSLTPDKATAQPAAAGRSNTTIPQKQETSTSLKNSTTTTPSAAARNASLRNADQAKPGTTAKTVPAQMPAAPQLQQDEPLVKVQWMSLEEAQEKAKTEKRKIFIDVFTDWCGWCKRMDESTFVDPEIAKYLNENYYPVKLNAEQQQDINFNNKTYHFRKNGARGYHELAAELLNNRLSFPTVVFLDESLNLIQSIPTYLEAPKLEAILNYFGTDSHKTTPWETYEKKFSNSPQR